MDFYQAMDLMGEHVFGKGAKFVNLVGIRAQESFRRYILMHKEKPVYKNITWASKYTNNPNAFLFSNKGLWIREGKKDGVIAVINANNLNVSKISPPLCKFFRANPAAYHFQ